MARYRSDIDYGYDDVSRVGYWTPDTPEFLEKREQRRAAQRSQSISYTQAKANIRQISLQNQAASASRQAPGGHASIIDFGELERGRPGIGGRVSFEGTTPRGSSVRFEAEAYRDARKSSSALRADRGARPSSRPAGRTYSPSTARNRQDRGDYFAQADSYRYNDWEDEIPFDDEVREERVDTSLRGKLRKARRDWKSRKADRAYTRSYGDMPSEPSGPRAAVYEGRMGRTHQRAARMQESARGGSGFRMPAFLSGIAEALSFDRLPVRPWFIYSALVVVCFAIVSVNVYPAAQNYYLQSRVNDQLAAEYQAVLERNEELEQHVAALQTDEGMEELAHESLGWVKDGDHSVSIVTDGSADPGTGALSETGSIVEGSVPTPETWYSPFLDVVFGYEG